MDVDDFPLHQSYKSETVVATRGVQVIKMIM